MSDQVEDYFQEVEAHFVERRGSPLFITPGEWFLIGKWEEEGIPLHVVKEGIDRVFERPQAAARPRKLGYCRQTIEAAFRRFREVSLGGGGDRAPAQEPFDASAHLSRIADELGSIAPDIAARVEALAANGDDLRAIEDELGSLDGELVELAEATIDDAERDSIRAEAEASLASYRERMPEKVYRSALKSAYRRRLRERAALPRLSLYDI